jgi:Na+-driven multidrug efflux pump
MCQITMGWELVFEQAFTGAGDTLPPMWVSVSTSVLRVPLAWWLAPYWGPTGVWWTISLTAVARGLWATLWFRRGNWKRKALSLPVHPELIPVPRGAEGPEG